EPPRPRKPSAGARAGPMRNRCAETERRIRSANKQEHRSLGKLAPSVCLQLLGRNSEGRSARRSKLPESPACQKPVGQSSRGSKPSYCPSSGPKSPESRRTTLEGSRREEPPPQASENPVLAYASGLCQSHANPKRKRGAGRFATVPLPALSRNCPRASRSIDGYAR